MNLQKLIDGFMLTIEASGDVESDDTVQWYKRRMNLFTLFVHKNEIDDPLTTDTFRRYAIYLKKRPRFDGRPGKLSASYRRGCLKALKRFGHWLYLEEHTRRDLGDVVSLPRLPKGEQLKAVTPDDMAKMIAGCKTPRDKALLPVLRDTGCRAGEMIKMRWKNVYEEYDRILVTGKRGKKRWVFLSAETVEALVAYKDVVPHGNDDPVWWSHMGRGDMRPLSYEGLYNILRRIANAQEIEGPWNPHAWRHAFCTRMNNAGVPTLNLQEFMGHESPETTKLYCKTSPDILKQIYDKYSDQD